MKPLALALWMALTGTVLAGEYFVSPTGKNTNPGTYARPWRTLYHALGRLRSHDDLYVRAGWYRENLNVYCFRGAPLKRIRVMAWQGEIVHIERLTLRAPNYWSVEDISFGTLTVIGGEGWDVNRCEGKIKVKGTPRGWRIVKAE